MSNAPDWTLDMPAEWKTGEWVKIDALAESDLLHGQALMVAGFLTDGTNVMAVLWPAGQRILRTGPPTDWAIQEHFTGRPPLATAGGGTIEEMWSVAVKMMIQAKTATDARFGPPPRASR